MRVALATFDPVRTETEPRATDLAYSEDALLVRALEGAAVAARAIPWTAPGVDWGAFDLVVVRTTWGYDAELPAFLDWARSVSQATRLRNPLKVLEWNTHKRYLADLAARGVPVPPTVHLPRGGRIDLVALLAERGWDEVVVKRAVTAGARGQRRVARRGAGAAQAEVAAVLAEADLLVQPFLPEIARSGERSLVYVDGRLSHAVAKIPAAGNYVAHPRHGARTLPHEPTPAERRVAEAALAAAPAAVLHARVDLVDLAPGQPAIMELELVEPYLFLDVEKGAAGRLAAAIREAALTPRSSSAAAGSP